MTYTAGQDLDALLSLATGARRILEFGTARGDTTLALARHCPQAEIVTVDVSRGTVAPGTFQECDLRHASEIGVAFRGQPEAHRITQFLCDAREPYHFHWPCDFVFVDGWHSFEGVAKDTLAALAMVKRGGKIVWDDRRLAGVPVLLEMIDKIAPVHYVAETRLAFVEVR